MAEKFNHEVFGISFNKLENHRDLFDYDFDNQGEEVVLSSKKTYTHEDNDVKYGDFKFNYKYVIQAIWNPDKAENDKVYISLNLVVTPDSMSQKNLKSVMEFCGLEDKEDIRMSDVIADGTGCIQFQCDKFIVNNDEELEYIFDKITSVVGMCDSLRGFYLDKTWNMIGTTGWNTLYDCLFDEDFMKATLDRYQK